MSKVYCICNLSFAVSLITNDLFDKTTDCETGTTEPDSMEPVPQTPANDRSHQVYMTITDMEGKLYSDQTGQFPITSNCGNCYVVIFFAADGNYIKSYPIKSRHRTQLLKAYEEVYAFL